MLTEDWLYDLNELIASLLPDFVLGFAFFTSIVYAALSKRFEHQRSAAAASASIGFALSLGLVWWEQANHLSIKDLGPVAVGFAILVLAFVIYASIRHIGGSWAGAGIALSACILITQVVGLDIPVDKEILSSLTAVALVIGIFAFLIHTGAHAKYRPARDDLPVTGPNMARLFRDRHLSDNLTKATRKLRKQSNSLNEHPQDAGDIMVQLKRMLPAQGCLTERMAQLRAKSHQIRNGHIARLEETKDISKNLPTGQKKKASEKMAAMYHQMIGVDNRLERLDNSVSETEKRIKELNLQAQQYTRSYNFQKLTECLKQAEKLQKHNSHLFKVIEGTEKKLIDIAKAVAKETKK